MHPEAPYARYSQNRKQTLNNCVSAPYLVSRSFARLFEARVLGKHMKMFRTERAKAVANIYFYCVFQNSFRKLRAQLKFFSSVHRPIKDMLIIICYCQSFG